MLHLVISYDNKNRAFESLKLELKGKEKDEGKKSQENKKQQKEMKRIQLLLVSLPDYQRIVFVLRNYSQILQLAQLVQK